MWFILAFSIPQFLKQKMPTCNMHVRKLYSGRRHVLKWLQLDLLLSYCQESDIGFSFWSVKGGFQLKKATNRTSKVFGKKHENPDWNTENLQICRWMCKGAKLRSFELFFQKANIDNMCFSSMMMFSLRLCEALSSQCVFLPHLKMLKVKHPFPQPTSPTTCF